MLSACNNQRLLPSAMTKTAMLSRFFLLASLQLALFGCLSTSYHSLERFLIIRGEIE